jgi:ATP-dependent DNA ligase
MAVPDNAVLDAEVVALHAKASPRSTSQNYRSSKVPLVFLIFDVLVRLGRDVMAETLNERRTVLEKHVSVTFHFFSFRKCFG